MKKLSLLLVVLLAAGSAGLYGQMAIGTNFSISGDATATVGYDIDDEQFGFKNESSANIKLELVAKQTSVKPEEAMSGWYGSIELKDFQIVINSDDEDSTEFVTTTASVPAGKTMPDPKGVEQEKKRSMLYVVEPTIVATLKNGPLWLQIFDAPGAEADLIAHIEDDEDGDHAAESDDDKADVGLDLGSQGITFGYTTADLSIAIGVLSEVAYDSESEDGVKDDPKTLYKDETKAPHEGSFAVSADLMVNVGPATLDLEFVQGIEASSDAEAADKDTDDDTGVGVMLTTDFGRVSLSAGADVQMTGEDDVAETNVNEAMLFDAGGSATVTLTDNTSLESSFIHSTKAGAATDVEVVLSDKNGLVENLSLELTWGLFDIVGGDEAATAAMDKNDESDLFLQGDLSYAIPVGDDMGDDDMMMKGPTLTPGTKVTINQLDGGDATVGLEVRALLEHAIPATTFGLKWATDTLFDAGAASAEQGTITLWTKIKY